MTNSYGVSEIPDGAVAGLYDSANGEWTGTFYFNDDDAFKSDAELDHSKDKYWFKTLKERRETLSIEWIDETDDE